MNVKAMYITLNGTNDTSFYKFTYQDTIVFVTRFHIDWSTNTYTVREITASRKSGAFYAPLGITQLDNNFENGDIATTAIAAMKSGAASVITVAAGIAVGWIVGTAWTALGLTATTTAAFGGLAALVFVYSDANASTTPYQEIKQPKPTKKEYEKLIEQNPILDSANWYGTSSPFVMTTGAKPKGETGVTVSGTLLANGGAPVKAQGICWNTNPGLLPTLSDRKIQVVAGAGLFSIDVVDLSPDTTYYFRTFATNSFGTSYGQVRSFKPTGTSDSITRILIEHGTWKAYFYAEEDSIKNILGKRFLSYWSSVCPNTPTFEYIYDSIEFRFYQNGIFLRRDSYGDRFYDLNESNCTSTPSSPMVIEWDEEEYNWQYLPNERIIRAQQEESGGYSFTLDFKVISFVNKELVLDIYYEECSQGNGCSRGYDGRIKLK
jgi:hypothetical protein